MSAFLSTQAAAIAEVIEAIDDCGAVFDHQPNPAPMDHAAFIAAFTAVVDGHRAIRAWTVQYQGEMREWTAIAIGATKAIRGIDWMVRLHVAWGEDTEHAFRALLDEAAGRLDAARSLGGTALDHTPVRITLPSQGAGILLGDVLCHYAELTFRAKVEQTLATT